MYEWNICKSTVDQKGFLIKTISKQTGTWITALKHLRSCFDFLSQLFILIKKNCHLLELLYNAVNLPRLCR